MPSDAFHIKQGDTAPVLRVQLRYDGGGIPPLEAAAVVEFVARSQRDGAERVRAAATVEDAATGTVVFAFTEEQTAIADRCDGEFVVTYLDDKQETFPTVDGTCVIIISPRG